MKLIKACIYKMSQRLVVIDLSNDIEEHTGYKFQKWKQSNQNQMEDIL